MTRLDEAGPPAGVATAAGPSRARFTLLGLLCLFTAVLYLDRVCMSQAVDPIQKDLSLTNTQMSYVLSAFTLAYGLFEVPTGWWGDRVGARRVLVRIAVWWSAFTVLTAACGGLISLLFVRFLFGAGEAGALPNSARVIARWFPLAERGRVQGFLTFAALLGGTLSPVLAAYLIAAAGWRTTFVVFGMTGFFWAALFWWWFRDDPAEHPSVNDLERALILGDGSDPGKKPGSAHGPIPWRQVLDTPTIWLLGLSMTCSSFNSYLYFSWLPKYLKAAREVPDKEAGLLASAVLGAGACGMLLGGFLVDRFCGQDAGRIARRRVLAVGALLAAAGLLLVALALDDPRAATAAIAASFLAASTVNTVWWASATEVSGRHIGALFGLMNSMGVFGAMSSQLFFGTFSDWRAAAGHVGRAQWDPAFYVYAVVLLIGAACWFFIDPSRPIGEVPAAEELAV